MSSQNPSLVCRFGFHRWTFETSQGSDELQATQEWYCPDCQIDRFDEAWFPTTRIDRWQEAVHTPFAKLHHSIQALLYRPPPTQYAKPSHRPKPDTAVWPEPRQGQGTPVLMAFITVHNQHAETSSAERSNDDRTRKQRSTTTD